MGLDGVELIMSVEEEFGIEIPDLTAGRLKTVSDLHMYVLGRLHERTTWIPKGSSPTKRCSSSHVFYRLRSALMKVAGTRRSELSPRSLMKDVWPWHRRRLWRLLAAEADLRLPDLHRPRWLVTSLWIFCIGGGLWSLYAIGAPTGLFFGVALGVLTGVLTIPLKRCLPPECVTMRDFTIETLKRSEARLTAEGGDIWPIIQRIVVEVLGVKQEDVTPNARFIEDLGAG